VDNDGGLAGFNVAVGGGMGVTHGNKKTYPRTGSLIGFCTPEQGHIVAEKIMLVQRDNGNRAEYVASVGSCLDHILTDIVSTVERFVSRK
jgi:sulfite reductase (NADPH) hemoprotein beta-component